MIAALAKELGPDDIRVNLVAPGILEDGISTPARRAAHEGIPQALRLARLGRLAEVASVVAWLARHNTYVTGHTVLVDGAL